MNVFKILLEGIFTFLFLFASNANADLKACRDKSNQTVFTNDPLVWAVKECVDIGPSSKKSLTKAKSLPKRDESPPSGFHNVIGKARCLVFTGSKTVENLNWDGPCKSGFADGDGLLSYQLQGKKVTYTGGVLIGQLNGTGRLEQGNSSIQGVFRNGLIHGYAKSSWGQETYEGFYYGNHMTGFGILTKDGETSTGIFIDGKREGVVHVAIPNKESEMIGQMTDGSPNGVLFTSMQGRLSVSVVSNFQLMDVNFLTLGEQSTGAISFVNLKKHITRDLRLGSSSCLTSAKDYEQYLSCHLAVNQGSSQQLFNIIEVLEQNRQVVMAEARRNLELERQNIAENIMRLQASQLAEQQAAMSAQNREIERLRDRPPQVIIQQVPVTPTSLRCRFTSRTMFDCD